MNGALSWSDALFTSVSAVTVTGLIVTDTGTSFWCQLIILLLIQAGGLGLMTFAVLALLALGGRIRGRHQMVASGGHNETHPRDLMQTAKEVVRLALIVEGIALVPLALVWIPEHGWLQGLWWSLFHSVSAFNNAGFTLSPDSLIGYAGNPVINAVVSSLYLIGGAGFIVIVGLLDYPRTRYLNINVKVVLLAATWSYLRQRHTPTLFSQPLSTTSLLKAMAVTVMAVTGIFMGTLALSIIEDAELLAIAFEATSAIGTVGLTRGLTAELSGAGQAIIMALMFVGRLCPLAVAYLVGSDFALSDKSARSELEIG